MPDAREQANRARNRGARSYQKGQLCEAKEAYLEAHNLVPNDPKPLSLLAAVELELGDYKATISYAKSALSLLGDEKEDAARKQKFFLRLAKSYILSRQLVECRQIVPKLSSKQERDTIESSLALNEPESDLPSLRTKVLDELPRYRPALYILCVKIASESSTMGLT